MGQFSHCQAVFCHCGEVNPLFSDVSQHACTLLAVSQNTLVPEILVEKYQAPALRGSLPQSYRTLWTGGMLALDEVVMALLQGVGK